MSPKASAIIDDPDERWGVGANARTKSRLTTWREKRAEKKRRKAGPLSKLQLFVYKLLFAHLGKFIIVGAYFFALQLLHGQHTTIGHSVIVLPDVKGTWDHLFSASIAHGGFIPLMSAHAWNGMRHVVFRGLIEGVLGVVLFNQIGFNVEKYRTKIEKKRAQGKTNLHWYNKFFASPYQNHPVTPLQYVFLPVLLVLITIVLGVPLYLGVDSLAHSLSLHWLTSPGIQHNFAQKLYTGSEVYEGLIIGLVVGFVAGHSYRAYLFANTMNLGRSWVSHDRSAKWWMPWPTRNLIRDLCREGVQRQKEKLAERHEAVKVVVPILGLTALSFAVLGYLVLQTNGFTH